MKFQVNVDTSNKRPIDAVVLTRKGKTFTLNRTALDAIAPLITAQTLNRTGLNAVSSPHYSTNFK